MSPRLGRKRTLINWTLVTVACMSGPVRAADVPAAWFVTGSGWEDYTLRTERTAVLSDIPDDARALSYGVVLSGQGTLYADDLQFRIVDKTVQTTGKPYARRPDSVRMSIDFSQLPSEPRNLDFETVTTR